MKLQRLPRFLPAAVILLAIILSGLDISADRLTAKNAFVQLPDSLIELLPVKLRQQMIDSFKMDKPSSVVNALGGLSKLERLDSTYAMIQLTSVSNMQIKILKKGVSDCIVGVSYTINGPEADSELFFFNSMMQPIPLRKILKTPDMQAYFKPVDKQKLNEIAAAIPFPTASYDFSPDNTSLTASLTSCAMLPRESRDSIASLLGTPLVFKWNNGKYHLSRR